MELKKLISGNFSRNKTAILEICSESKQSCIKIRYKKIKINKHRYIYEMKKSSD